MTPRDFIIRWRDHALTERSAAQQHFLGLCKLLGLQEPAEIDPRGEFFTFEKGVPKTGGGDGFADVWYAGRFAWEYKKRKRDLDAAMKQLADYSAALDNPPIHVACDTIKFRIETRFTNTVTKRWEFDLEDLMDDRNLAVLRAVFHDPEQLRPSETRDSLTREAANKFQKISDLLQERYPLRKEEVAHFVNQLVFCFFADSVRLLPNGGPDGRQSLVWKKLLLSATEDPADGNASLRTLFGLMAKEPGGRMAFEKIRWFNGKLFDGRPPLELTRDDFHLLLDAARVKWDLIDPTIFGTLFERFLDPDKRAQIGAHYTDPDKINLILEPVLLRPLRAEWAAAREAIDKALIKTGAAALKKATAIRDAFLERLRSLTILDPACGSGNFLYLALQHVKDLELKAIRECEPLGLDRVRPAVSPRILKGIEINPFAAELARAVIWIGDLQWEIRNDLLRRTDPVLEDLDQIQCRDALVAPDGSEADWPEAEFIVGNPPFLGGKKLRRDLTDEKVERLFAVYDGRVPREADLVAYWFEKAREQIAVGKSRRAGLVATNSMRGGANRKVLEKAFSDAPVFEAWADEPWIVDGAAVRVSMICFGRAMEGDALRLDGAAVEQINSDLSGAGADLTRASRLRENAGVAFMGDTKGGAFDIEGKLARAWLKEPLNPNGRPNSDVLRPWVNGLDVTRQPRDMWIIDFGTTMSEAQAALYQEPFAYLTERVKPERMTNNRKSYREFWWRHVEPRPAMWVGLEAVARFVATPTVTKHRLFSWITASTCPDHQLIAIARDDDTTFGILHSRFHEAWSLRLGTSLEDRPRYTPTTTFETFPFPEGLTPDVPATAYAADPRAVRIAAAAAELDRLRCNWLHPADLGDWLPEITPTSTPGEQPRRYPDRFVPKNVEAAAKLRERTLTNLYNQRPAWLSAAHDAIDRAVAAAYGWLEDITIDEALARLLALNLERAATGR